MPHRNKIRTYNAPATMRIGGEVVNKIVARYAYRCAECLGELKYHNNGLACAANVAHQGFIHKKEAAQTAELQKENIKELEQFYSIIDGKVVIKNGD
jgi:hypothetical protein